MTRHERKLKRAALFVEQEAARQAKAAREEIERPLREARRREYERDHPVSAGKIPLVDYAPPHTPNY
jgi:hypothetical protein